MPKYLPLALAALCAATLAARPAAAQSAAPRAGRLHYDFTQRVDQTKVKVMMFGPDGQEIKGDTPGGPELPSSLSGRRELAYSGDFAREEQARDVQPVGGTFTVTAQAGAPQRTFRRSAPVLDTRYLNLADRTVTTVSTIGGTSYVLPPKAVPAPPAGWQDLPQTRKIAGLLCHKVTVPYRQETYTLWVTTELPFTYSPVPELTPARGVVLAVSSDQEEFIATRLTAAPVAEAEVRPGAQARPVSETELKKLKDKARADDRQRMLEQFSNAGPR